MESDKELKDKKAEEEEEEVNVNIEELEVNSFSSTDIVLIAPHGFSSAYVRAALYSQLKGSTALKSKYQIVNQKDKKARRKIAFELYQFVHSQASYSVILPTSSFNAKCYKPLNSLIFEKLTPKQVLVLDSINSKGLHRLGKTSADASLFTFTNSHTSKLELPSSPLYFPNVVKGIAAYYFTACEAKSVPCSIIVGVPEESKVSLKSVAVFSPLENILAPLKGSLEVSFLVQNKIDIELAVFSKYNESLTNLFT